MNNHPNSVRHASFLKRHAFTILMLALVVGIVWFRWPMIKGLAYSGADGAPDSGIAWRTDYDAALAEAGTADKPVLLTFTAGWCPPCRVMKHEVWPDQQVRALANDRFVPVLVDLDRPDSRRLIQRYNVSGIPTIIVVDAQGEVLRQSGFLARDAMVRFLERS